MRTILVVLALCVAGCYPLGALFATRAAVALARDESSDAAAALVDAGVDAHPEASACVSDATSDGGE